MTASRSSPVKKSPAKYDDLAALIQTAIDTLEAAHVMDAGDADTDHARYNGYCSRACSAYQYLVAHEPRAERLSENPGMKLKVLKKPGSAYGDSHYWLEDDQGRILDLVFEERKRLARAVGYEEGKGTGVRRDKANKNLPARHDTQRIIDVVRAALNWQPGTSRAGLR